MKIWKFAAILVVVVVSFSALGAGIVFARAVAPNLGGFGWGNWMGSMMNGAAASPAFQATPGSGYGMMGRGGMMGSGNMGAMHQWMMGANGMHTQVLTDLAKTLNLSLDELQSQLQSGKTLAQIAQTQGVSQADLEAALQASIKTHLDEAVAAGALTQEQADRMLSFMDGNYSRMIEMMGWMGAGRGGGCSGWQGDSF